MQVSEGQPKRDLAGSVAGLVSKPGSPRSLSDALTAVPVPFYKNYYSTFLPPLRATEWIVPRVFEEPMFSVLLSIVFALFLTT